MNNVDWSLYRSFLAVLRAGSLLAAARDLGIAQPTLGRHIDALEAALGQSLFVRSPHGLAPTEHALLLRPYAEALDATSAALLRAASGDNDAPRGVVRITSSEVVGCEILPPILADIQQRYPEIKIELAPTNRAQDLLRREADIAVRMVQPAQEALIAKRLGSVELGMFAHPRYIERKGLPRKLADLKKHVLIGFDHENAFIRSVKHHLGDLTREDFALRTDSDVAQLAAIRAGYGLGICQAGIARRDGLVRVLPSAFAFGLDTWLAMHEDLRTSKRCSVIYAALAEGLSGYISAD